MSKNCNHKDKNGDSLIEDGICKRCGTEFGVKFIKKMADKRKRNKSLHREILEEVE